MRTLALLLLALAACRCGGPDEVPSVDASEPTVDAGTDAGTPFCTPTIQYVCVGPFAPADGGCVWRNHPCP